MRESTLKKAFVGVKGEESEIWRLLLQCGAESLADVVLCPNPGVASRELIMDERPPMNAEEYQTLCESLVGVSRGKIIDFLSSSFERSAIRDYFVEQIVASGKRVPSQRLFSFVDIIQADILPPRGRSALFGRLGRWLLQNAPSNDDDSFTTALPPLEIFEPSPNKEAATNVWREGSDADRVVVIAELRKRDPARAVELLRKDWKKIQKSGCKHDCLNEFFVGLSENDLDFLQGLEKKTRDFCALEVLRDLLANLPTSKYAQKTFERAEVFLKNPESLKEFGSSQGERENFMFEEPNASTLRSAFLTLSRVPLEKWEEILSAPPKEIRARLLDVKGLSHFTMAQTFSTAQLRSFSLFGASDEWFEVCCESFTDVFRFDPERRRYQGWRMLYNAFPRLHAAVQNFIKSVVATGRVDYFERLRAIWQEETAEKNKLGTRREFDYALLDTALRHSPYPWSEEAARVFCKMLIEQISAMLLKYPQEITKNDGAFYLLEKFAHTIAFSPRVVREEFHDVATKGNDSFTPNEDFVKVYLDACAWRERFDRLFGKSEKN